MTEKLYYGDSSALDFEATVVGVQEHDGRTEVELDRTAFYPGGGGQPCDIGTLAGARVVETAWRGESIVHVVEPRIEAAAGSTVRGAVDPAHRRAYMVQHTGQHVFSQALVQAGKLETVSVHFGEDETTIELRAEEVPPATLEKAEDIANGIVTENRRVLLHEVDRAEASRFPLRRTPPDEPRLRIVEVESFDWAACGGVHVARTGEIGLIKAVSQEKIRGRTRLHLLIGKRAFDDYRRKIGTGPGAEPCPDVRGGFHRAAGGGADRARARGRAGSCAVSALRRPPRTRTTRCPPPPASAPCPASGGCSTARGRTISRHSWTGR